LSALGLYGVVSFAVTRQTREIGVRIALGAGRSRVVRRVVAGGFVLALPGVAVGLLLSLGVGRIVEGILLFSALDPLTYVTVVSVLATVVAVACLLPAARAAAVQPMEALRFD
jgi:ABC-type antimicrobial peptide transport system permease subunit